VSAPPVPVPVPVPVIVAAAQAAAHQSNAIGWVVIVVLLAFGAYLLARWVRR
jgi:hypothetical protein